MSKPPPAPYVMLKGAGKNKAAPSPPHDHHHDPYPSYHPKRRNNNCFKYICCCYCLLYLIIIILALISLYFFAFYEPKIPSYKIDDLQVKVFDLRPDFTLKSNFLLSLNVENPNGKIGLTYGEDSSIDVVFSNSDLCSGKLPHFHQGHDNTTLMNIDLWGNSQFGSGIREALAKSEKNHMIPLLVKVRVPVKIVVGNFPLRQFKFFVNCSIVVDNLVPNKKIGIKSSRSSVHFEF